MIIADLFRYYKAYLMNKKYEMVADDTFEIDDAVLHRIRAIRDFGNVKKGDLGGYIEKEANLSHNGNAWVSGNACVFKGARVSENAVVSGHSWVTGNALVYGEARVCNNAYVFQQARVYGNAKVSDWALVYGEVRVYDYARVDGNMSVSGYRRVTV